MKKVFMNEKFSINKLTPEEWASFSQTVHRVVFKEIISENFLRFDFALIVEDMEHKSCSYVLCRDYGNDTVYMQYGGSFPNTVGVENKSLETFDAIQSYIFSKFQRVTFLVDNSNFPMLKFAMKAGFKIIGIRNYGNKIFLEHFKEN